VLLSPNFNCSKLPILPIATKFASKEIKEATALASETNLFQIKIL